MIRNSFCTSNARFGDFKSSDLHDCDFILCTGLFDDYDNDLDYYKKFLLKHISKKLICTNPDLIVHRGNTEELCAGSVAKVFEDLGGEVIYFGKPHKEIYNMCFGSNEKVLAIGDNLRTDIKGANNLKIDCIFISEGVHRKEFNNFSELNKLSQNDSIVSYLPLSIPTNLLFTYITSLVCGMSFNLPERNQTIEKDLQEIGPSILYAPSFVYKHIITSIVFL